MSSVTRRIIVRIVGIADRCNNISWPDFLEREGGREGRRVMDRSEASQRIRVAAAAYSPRLESSPSSQSMDTPETLETPHAVRPVFGQGFSSPFASRLTLANVFVCTVALSAPPTTFSSSRY